MMPSITAVQSLYHRGFIGKEAAVRILAKREDLIKKAAGGVFSRWQKAKPGFLGQLGKAFAPSGEVRSRWGGGLLGRKEKPAGSDYAKMLANVVKTVGIGSGLAAGAAGVHAGVSAVGNIGTRKRIQQSRREVIQNLASQGGEQATDAMKGHYDSAFSVLAEYAPSIATNPVVATSMVHHIVSAAPKGRSPIISADLIKNLVDIEANVEKGRQGKGFVRPFSMTHSGGKTLQLGSKISGSE